MKSNNYNQNTNNSNRKINKVVTQINQNSHCITERSTHLKQSKPSLVHKQGTIYLLSELDEFIKKQEVKNN